MPARFERVFVVDDDSVIRWMLVNHLQKQCAAVLGLATVAQTLEEFRREPADLVLVDLQLPDGTGIDIIGAVKRAAPATEVMMMTGFATVESAVEAIKYGAASYLLKPFTTAQLDVAIRQVLDQRRLRSENAYLREQLEETSTGGGEMLFRAQEMVAIHNLIRRVAPTDATVLIQGESGTGKELVARAIHENSLRRDGPYVKINCAAVPENLLESEFFGHERGAFTGATGKREGRFELAHGGTILLDEVTEIPPGLQAKLLRVLQEREFERVGGNRTIQVDVRVLATTNRDPAAAVAEGRFRQDLFYRLNVVPLRLPALRDRRGEVEFLIERFLQRFAAKYGKRVPRISPLAREQLIRYPWPGNVRELQNCAERAVILAEDGQELEFRDFLGTAARSDTAESCLETTDRFPTIAEMERRLILLALKKTQGNRNEAARMLDINVRTLRTKLKQYGEPPASERKRQPSAPGAAAGADQSAA